MKFKSIFILFSMLLLIVLAFLVLLPHFMLGPYLAGSFWRNNWPFILILALIFAVFNIFYFANRRLFSLLEKEDWPALVRYLEERVIRKNRYSSRLIRLLANSYMVLSDSASVMGLENKTAIVKPALVDANALVFGTARILGKDISGAVRFFETRKDRVRPGIKEWVCWYYGFALLLNRQFEDAAREFSLLARLSKDGVIAALSSYFLSETIAPLIPGKRLELRDISSEGRERVRRALARIEDWNREISRLSAEIHAAAIFKYMEEAGRWLYTTGISAKEELHEKL